MEDKSRISSVTLLGQLTEEQRLLIGRRWAINKELSRQPVPGDPKLLAEKSEIERMANMILAEAASKSKSGEAYSTPIRGKPGQAELFSRLKAENRTH